MFYFFYILKYLWGRCGAAVRVFCVLTAVPAEGVAKDTFAQAKGLLLRGTLPPQEKLLSFGCYFLFVFLNFGDVVFCDRYVVFEAEVVPDGVPWQSFCFFKQC